MSLRKILDVIIVLVFALISWGLLTFVVFLFYVNYTSISPEMSGSGIRSKILLGCFVFITGFVCYVVIKYIRKMFKE